MIRQFKKTYARVTWPYRKRFSRAKSRAQALDGMRHLQPMSVKESAIRLAKHLLICRIVPDTGRLVAFLEHYRRMGVDHFLLIDASGSEEVSAMLAGYDDCSVWRGRIGFRESEYGKKFFHSLLHTFCLRKWTLCVDPDELFIFPYMETRSLQDLAGQLDDCERTTLWAIQVETYGSAPVLETDCMSEDLQHFDPSGYYQSYGSRGQLEVRGGPGMRLARKFTLAEVADLAGLSLERLQRELPETFGDVIDSGRLDMAATLRGMTPTLHKLPFVKPDECFFYQYRNCNAVDEKLNWPHKWHPCPTGALLTPKYHKQYGEKLLSGRGEASGIPGWSDIESVFAKHLRSTPKFSFMESWSARFESSESLIECGLLTDGAALRPSSLIAS